MTWHRLVTVPTPEQLERRDEERQADRHPGDHRLRGASRPCLERAHDATMDLCQTHLSRYRDGARR